MKFKNKRALLGKTYWAILWKDGTLDCTEEDSDVAHLMLYRTKARAQEELDTLLKDSELMLDEIVKVKLHHASR